MPIDLDPFHDWDVDFDHQVDAHDLQMYELTHHGDFSLHDLNHDGIWDQFQNDLNHDLQFDQFQADLDHNSVIDRFETTMPGATQLNVDLDGNGSTDYMDEALARNYLNV
ncbi:hypothetical protein [Neobacillus dielmonensis]|uniref:hypothetical protein n=1 Tax=Neobacillus dielmonensis TaxID=1347369 RepID=UPI0005A6F5E7|nr:hypothetical protein [Neobacillus dielmonensis]